MNSLLQSYRQRYDDPRSDAEILSVIAERHPEAFKQYPDALADFQKLSAPQQQESAPLAIAPDDEVSASNYFKQAAGSFVRGAGNMLASIPEGVAIARESYDRFVPEPLRRAAAMVNPAEWVDTASSAAEKATGLNLPNTAELLRSSSEGIRDVAKMVSPDEVPELKESFWATKLPSGMGSVLGFLAGGVAGQAAKIPAWLSIAGMGSMAKSSEFYNDAKQNGADDETAAISALVGNVVGTSEAIPLANMVKRLNKATGNQFGKWLVTAGKETIEEAMQEAGQQLAQNYTAQQLYDKDRDLMKDLYDNTAVGGATGFLFSILTSALGVKASRVPKSEPAPPPASTTAANPPTGRAAPATTELAEIAEQYELSASEIKSIKENRAKLEAAYPELAAPPAATPEQGAVEVAALETKPNPTAAEKKSGKYAKGQVLLEDVGLLVDIENAAGSERTGTDKDGEKWSVTMPAIYGELPGYRGKDKDWIDIYLGPDVTQPNVVVVNQFNPETGKFDEHKTMLGFTTPELALATYDAAFSDGSGPSRRKSYVEMSKSELRTWLKEGDKNKPAEKAVAAPAVVETTPVAAAPAPVPVNPARAAAIRSAIAKPVARPTPRRVSVEDIDAIEEAAMAQAKPVPAPPAAPAPRRASLDDIDAIEAAAEEQAAPVAAAPTEPQFNADAFVGGIDFPTIEGEGKQTAQAVGGTPGRGKQASAGFEETTDINRIVADSTAGTGKGDYGLSRKVGIFRSADGSLTLASVYDVKNPKVSTSSGKGQSLSKFIAAGNTPVGAVKIVSPSKGVSITVPAAQSESFLSTLRSRQEETAKQFTQAVVPVKTDVDTATPDAAIIAAEGFTPDEAEVIWNVAKDLTPDEIITHLPRAAIDRDVAHALGKILNTFEDAGLDTKDALANTLSYVQDAKRLADAQKASGQSQNTFVQTIVREIGNFAREGNQPGQEVAAEAEEGGTAAAAAKPAGERSGGKAKEGGRRTRSRAKPAATGEAKNVRHRLPETQPGWRLANEETRERFESAMEGLEASGISVETVGLEIDGMVADAGGIYSPSGKSITLYVADAVHPNRGNLISIFHEAADAVSENETVEVKLRLHRAVASLTDEALDIVGWAPKISESISASEAEVVRNLERLSESVARKLESQGFNPAEARGFWNALVRWMRDIWYRVSMAIQAARFGENHIETETAEAYFVNRLISLLAGDSGSFSFLSWIGGSKPTGGTEAGMYAPAEGSGGLAEVYDPNTDAMVYPEAREDSVAAVRFNNTVRYRDLEFKSDPTTDISRETTINETVNAAEKIAAQNEIRNVISEMHRDWTAKGGNSSGMTLEEFWSSGNFTQLPNPQSMIEAQNEGVVNAGHQPADPSTRMEDLPSESYQQRAANTAYKNLLSEQARMERQVKDWGAELSPRNGSNLNAQLERKAARLRGMIQQYTNLDYMANESVEIMDAMLDEARRDARDVGQLARRHGAIAQTISNIEVRMDDGIMAQYVGAMQRLFNRWKTDSAARGKFADTLQAAAMVEDINWSADSAVRIKQKLLDAARTTPELSHLIQPTSDRRAEMAMIVAFGRQNFNVMTFLEMRKRDYGLEKVQVNEALKLAMGAHKSSIAEARKMVAPLVRASVSASKLLDAIEQTKAENRALMDEIQRKETFIEFYHDTAPTMRRHLDALGKVIGAVSEDFEAYDGATVMVPNNPTDPPSAWEKKTLRFKENGTSYEETNQWISRMDSALLAVPEPQWSPNHKAMKVARDKLLAVQMRLTFDPIKTNLLTRMVGSITDKLRSTGHPAAKIAADMITKIDSHLAWDARNRQIKGTSWSVAEGQVKAEVERIWGRKVDIETLRDFIWNGSLKFFENRQDIWAENTDPAQARAVALRELRNEYMSRGEESRRLAEDPKFWMAMHKLINQSEQNANFLVSAAKAMGRKIEDMGYYRNPIGKAPGTMMRTWRRTTEGLWREMQANWDGTAKKKLNGNWVQDMYEESPDDLRAEVQSRVSDRVWNSFVREIAENAGRSSFYSPMAVNQRVRALRENVVKAFQSADPGDLVGLAENLHRLEAESLTDKPVIPVGEYVADVLATFQNFYNMLHGEFAENAESAYKGVPRPNRVMMNARVSEEAPSGWLEYMPMDAQSMRLAVESMAFQFGGGRNLDPIRANFAAAKSDLQLLDQEYQAMRLKYKEQGKSGRALREAMQAEARARGGEGQLQRMENASKNARVVESMASAFDGMVKSRLDFPIEMRTFVEAVGTLAGVTVQGPATALSDISYLFIQPFRNLGFTKEAFELATHHGKVLAEANLGSFGWLLRQQLNLDVEDNKAIHAMGWDEADASLNIQGKLEELMHEQLFLPDPAGRGWLAQTGIKFGRAFKLANRGVKVVLGTGVGRGSDERFSYPTFKPHAPFTMFSQFQHLATIKGMWKLVRPRVVKAIDFFNENTDALADPLFKLKHSDIGMSEKSFNYLQDRLTDFGLSFEGLAKDAILRRVTDPNAPPLLPEHYRHLGHMGMTETVMESGLTTRSPFFINNPIGALIAPLTAWGFQSSNSFAKRAVDPVLNAQGTAETSKAVWGTLMPYMAILPLGLAFALWREWFDENALGKKANVQGFGQNNNLLAMLEKLGRASVFGTAGDAVNSLVNTDTNRPFSVDSRVLFLNSLFGVGRAVSNFFKQGMVADYQTVMRPLMTSLGGSGFLQQVALLNRTMTGATGEPLIEAEARVVGRQNLANYLRAAGRELKMDVRQASFGATPVYNPAKPYVARMLMAAYANSPSEFADARMKAIVTRMREEKVDREKAEDYVKRSYQGMNPLSTVFITRPSEQEFVRLLGTMNDHGKATVMTAVRNYHHYGSVIGIDPSWGKDREEASRKRSSRPASFRQPSLNDLRRQAMAF